MAPAEGNARAPIFGVAARGPGAGQDALDDPERLHGGITTMFASSTRVLVMSGVLLCAGCAARATALDLLFSEYVEGSGNNKALEFYNGGDVPVELGPYEVQMYFNGNPSAGLTIDLVGSVPPRGVFLLVNGNAEPALLALADQTQGSGWFNGDDAVVLLKGGAVVDAIGRIGEDPGSEWGGGPTGTQNATLRRKAGIGQGDSDAFDPFDPALQWDGFPQDSFDGLGRHGDDGDDPGGPVHGLCGDPATPIHAIQGDGPASPLAGQAHTVEAVVVGDFQDPGQLGGYFLQEEDTDADADPLSSEGLFVFDTGTAVSPGQRLRVTGTVTEFFDLTELTTVVETTVCGPGPAVTPAVLTLPLAGPASLEAYEGMAVVLPQTLTVTDVFSLGRFGELSLSSGGRLFTPTAVVSPGAAANALQAANDLNRILLDDGRTVQNPEPIPHPAPGLAATRPLRVGYTVSGLTGVLGYGFGAYRLQPTAPPAFEAANPRTPAPRLPGAGRLRVASFNVLNFFNGDGRGSGFPTPRGADTALELERQTAKIVAAVIALDADVLGLMELENDGYGPDSAIHELVAALNAAGGGYAVVDPGVAGLGGDAIAVGLIYRPAAVAPVSGAAILDSGVDPLFDDIRNRPALAQTFREVASGETFTVVVNHFKSKGLPCDDAGDPDNGDGQGNCNLTRLKAAQALTRWLAGDPTGAGDPDVLIMGDLNAYAMEDPIVAIRSAGYVNLIHTFQGPTAYSFVFFGQSGYLDHALASPSLAAQVTGAGEWPINADEPPVLDYNTEFKSAAQVEGLFAPDPYRASDHDPLLVELSLSAGGAMIPGDLDGDDDVDREDLNLILAANGQPASGPDDARDLDGDGTITYRDARKLRLLCSRARCATE